MNEHLRKKTTEERLHRREPHLVLDVLLVDFIGAYPFRAKASLQDLKHTSNFSFSKHIYLIIVNTLRRGLYQKANVDVVAIPKEISTNKTKELRFMRETRVRRKLISYGK